MPDFLHDATSHSCLSNSPEVSDIWLRINIFIPWVMDVHLLLLFSLSLMGDGKQRRK